MGVTVCDALSILQVQQVGKERLVLDLSCRRREPGGPYHVVTDRWQKFSNFVLSKESLTELAQSCDEFLVHGVDQEGKRLGIDEDLVSLLASHSPIPVTYAGGVRSLVSSASVVMIFLLTLACYDIISLRFKSQVT